jgi:hypothetical protein
MLLRTSLNLAKRGYLFPLLLLVSLIRFFGVAVPLNICNSQELLNRPQTVEGDKLLLHSAEMLLQETVLNIILFVVYSDQLC